ncbi:MAG: hypothetical protein OEM82_05335 [Acidobacteriota bacterium]|nr:hypothetical protein [Acidobacteriota bacterium]MDH3529057.1 hypothetical protein [Acidobacteriota bacterium]
MISEGVVKLSEFAELQKQERVPTGVAPFDELTGGLVRGGICEFFGKKGSGKRSVVFAILTNMTRENKICAVVDTSNSFDPVSAAGCGMHLGKVLWIKCDDDPQKAVLATDYLIQSRLFGAVWLDMSLCEKDFLDRMPNSYWFRFKVGLKDSASALLVTLEEARMRSATQQSVFVSKEKNGWEGESCFRVMREGEISLEVIRGRKGNSALRVQGSGF